jgi:hypothetical protein
MVSFLMVSGVPVVDMTGLDRVIPHFASLEQAVARRLLPRSGRGGPNAPRGCAAAPRATGQRRERERGICGG